MRIIDCMTPCPVAPSLLPASVRRPAEPYLPQTPDRRAEQMADLNRMLGLQLGMLALDPDLAEG